MVMFVVPVHAAKLEEANVSENTVSADAVGRSGLGGDDEHACKSHRRGDPKGYVSAVHPGSPPVTGYDPRVTNLHAMKHTWYSRRRPMDG